MGDSFDMQKRYFTSQLKQFGTKPALNRARMKDCEYYLEMLEEAGSPGEFKTRIQQTGNRSGHLFQVFQFLQMDANLLFRC